MITNIPAESAKISEKSEWKKVIVIRNPRAEHRLKLNESCRNIVRAAMRQGEKEAAAEVSRSIVVYKETVKN